MDNLDCCHVPLKVQSRWQQPDGEVCGITHPAQACLPACLPVRRDVSCHTHQALLNPQLRDMDNEKMSASLGMSGVVLHLGALSDAELQRRLLSLAGKRWLSVWLSCRRLPLSLSGKCKLSVRPGWKRLPLSLITKYRFLPESPDPCCVPRPHS